MIWYMCQHQFVVQVDGLVLGYRRRHLDQNDAMIPARLGIERSVQSFWFSSPWLLSGRMLKAYLDERGTPSVDAEEVAA